MQQAYKCPEVDAKMCAVVVWFVKWVTGKAVTRREGMSQFYICRTAFLAESSEGPEKGNGSNGLRSRP